MRSRVACCAAAWREARESACWPRNSAVYLIAYIGIMRAGMVAVPINFKLMRETIEHVERDSEISLMLVDGERRALAGAGAVGSHGRCGRVGGAS